MAIPQYTFSPGTTIESAKANANWAQMALMALRSGDTLTGTYNTQHLLAAVFNTYDVGSVARAYRDVFAKGVKLVDTGNDHVVRIILNENVGADRVLNLLVGAANRTLNLGADLVIQAAFTLAGSGGILTLNGNATIASGASVSGTNTGDKNTVKVLTTDSGSATADAVEDTLNIVKGNEGVAISGATKTVTIKGRKIQTYTAETIADAVGTNDYGPYATDGFLLVELNYQGPAGANASSAEIRVGTANPPTDVRATWYRSIADTITADCITVPIKEGERVRVIATAAGGDEPAIFTKIHFYPHSTA